MHDLLIREFKGESFKNFVLDGRPCWIGLDIAEYFGYRNKSRAIFDCIKRENFIEGEEYAILEGDTLKLFKEVFAEQVEDYKFAPKIVILYEEGLYGFLGYTEKPLGVEFRHWIRKDVMPALRKKGYYVMDDVEINEEVISSKVHKSKSEKDGSSAGFDKFSTEKLESFRMALEAAKVFAPVLDKATKDPTYKLLYLKKIFLEAGIELPKFIEEEIM
ncbi:MAG: BRO family protein [Sarcina sp.]